MEANIIGNTTATPSAEPMSGEERVEMTRDELVRLCYALVKLDQTLAVLSDHEVNHHITDAVWGDRENALEAVINAAVGSWKTSLAWGYGGYEDLACASCRELQETAVTKAFAVLEQDWDTVTCSDCTAEYEAKAQASREKGHICYHCRAAEDAKKQVGPISQVTE